MSRPRASDNGTVDPDEVVVLRTIQESIRERGYPPSQREIAAACGWASVSGANALLKLMEARHLIDLSPRIPRGMRITPAGKKRISATRMVEASETMS